MQHRFDCNMLREVLVVKDKGAGSGRGGLVTQVKSL